jgi:hypothetical protein
MHLSFVPIVVEVAPAITISVGIGNCVFALPRNTDNETVVPDDGNPMIPDVKPLTAFVKYSDILIGFVPPNSV